MLACGSFWRCSIIPYEILVPASVDLEIRMESSRANRETVSIFISHAEADRRLAEDLDKLLSAEGFDVFRNSKDLSSNDVAGVSVTELIRKSTFFLAGLSRNTVNPEGQIKSNVRKELRILWNGIDNNAFLIPVRLEECPVPEKLSGFEPVDLFLKDGFQTLMGQIHAAMARRTMLIEAFPDFLGASDTSNDEEGLDSEQKDQSLEGPTDPMSVYAWHVDLRKLLAGEREDSLQRLGGVEEYIEVMLAEASDTSEARAAFETALEQVIQGWQPSILDSEVNQSHVLDLLSAYTPLAGFVKIVGFAMALRRALFRKVDQYTYHLQDLYLGAFVTIENYYPGPPQPPADVASSYRNYIDLMKEDLRSPEHCGYALKRLVELKIMALDRDEIENLIELNPKSLAPLTKLVLDPVRQSTAQHYLSLIYTLSLEAGDEVELEFEYAIVSCGGQLIRFDERTPKVSFNEVSFDLDLPPESEYQYWELIQERESKAGLMKDENILAASANRGTGT